MSTPLHYSFIGLAREHAPHDEYKRRIAKVIRHDPSPEQRAEYEAAKAAYEVLIGYSGFWADDHGLDEPRGEVEVVYAETEDEGRERIAKLPKFVTIPVMNSRAARD